MKIKLGINSFLIGFLIFLIGLYIFPESTKFFVMIFLFFILLSFIFQGKYMLHTYMVVPWIIYVLLNLITIPFSYSNFSDAIEIIVSILIFLLLIGMDYNKKLIKKTFMCLNFFYIIVILGCFLQIFFPELLININKLTLGSEKYQIFYMFYRGKNLVGFSYQTAVTGFYLTLFAGYLSVYLFSNANEILWKKIIALIILIMLLIMIFYTGKRIFIILSILGISIICSVYNKKHFFKILLCIIALVIGIWLLLNNTSYGLKILTRSLVSDPTTGRSKINAFLIQCFQEKPILGNGIGSTLTLLKKYQNGHNVYLQLLSESGIVGLGLAIYSFIYSLRKSIKLLKNNKINKDEKNIITFCLFVQIIFLGWCLTGNPFYDIYPLMIYMICNGIVLNLSTKNMEEKDENSNIDSLL